MITRAEYDSNGKVGSTRKLLKFIVVVDVDRTLHLRAPARHEKTVRSVRSCGSSHFFHLTISNLAQEDYQLPGELPGTWDSRLILNIAYGISSSSTSWGGQALAASPGSNRNDVITAVSNVMRKIPSVVILYTDANEEN